MGELVKIRVARAIRVRSKVHRSITLSYLRSSSRQMIASESFAASGWRSHKRGWGSCAYLRNRSKGRA